MSNHLKYKSMWSKMPNFGRVNLDFCGDQLNENDDNAIASSKQWQVTWTSHKYKQTVFNPFSTQRMSVYLRKTLQKILWLRSSTVYLKRTNKVHYFFQGQFK